MTVPLFKIKDSTDSCLKQSDACRNIIYVFPYDANKISLWFDLYKYCPCYVCVYYKFKNVTNHIDTDQIQAAKPIEIYQLSIQYHIFLYYP